jgi:hypothetical protein
MKVLKTFQVSKTWLVEAESEEKAIGIAEELEEAQGGWSVKEVEPIAPSTPVSIPF